MPQANITAIATANTRINSSTNTTVSATAKATVKLKRNSNCRIQFRRSPEKQQLAWELSFRCFMHCMCYLQGYYEIWMSFSLLFRHWMCKLSRQLRNLKDFVIPWIECERLPEISMISRWLQRMKYLGSSPLFQLPKVSWNWSNLQAWHSKTDG